MTYDNIMQKRITLNNVDENKLEELCINFHSQMKKMYTK